MILRNVLIKYFIIINLGRSINNLSFFESEDLVYLKKDISENKGS